MSTKSLVQKQKQQQHALIGQVHPLFHEAEHRFQWLKSFLITLNYTLTFFTSSWLLSSYRHLFTAPGELRPGVSARCTRSRLIVPISWILDFASIEHQPYLVQAYTTVQILAPLSLQYLRNGWMPYPMIKFGQSLCWALVCWLNLLFLLVESLAVLHQIECVKNSNEMKTERINLTTADAAGHLGSVLLLSMIQTPGLVFWLASDVYFCVKSAFLQLLRRRKMEDKNNNIPKQQSYESNNLVIIVMQPNDVIGLSMLKWTALVGHLLWLVIGGNSVALSLSDREYLESLVNKNQNEILSFMEYNILDRALPGPPHTQGVYLHLFSSGVALLLLSFVLLHRPRLYWRPHSRWVLLGLWYSALWFELVMWVALKRLEQHQHQQASKDGSSNSSLIRRLFLGSILVYPVIGLIWFNNNLLGLYGTGGRNSSENNSIGESNANDSNNETIRQGNDDTNDTNNSTEEQNKAQLDWFLYPVVSTAVPPPSPVAV